MQIAITTLGCKVNQYDSAVIQARLEKEQHSFVSFDSPADFYIINSCTVTDRADWEARQLVRRVKRLSPNARILVTGCYAQVNPEALARLPEVDFVVGLNRLNDLIFYVDHGGNPQRTQVSIGEVKKERKVPVIGTRGLPGHTRAFLKIQEGCNYSCTFCIIPTARGLSRSVPPKEVLRQIASLADQGYVEVVLTGIHLGSYGHDLQPKTDLSGLLEKIEESHMVPRLRLSSLDPREVPDRLLDLMASSELVCPHLHICLQAGENGILKRMRRNYDTSYYRDLLFRVRDRLPDAALGTDLIVGFPGETEADFENSVEYLESLPLTYFHVFPYSIRTGTVAARLPEQVSPLVKKVRAAKMREVGLRKKRAFYSSFVDRRASVLLETQLANKLFKGYSRNYIPVVVVADGDLVNVEVEVVLEGLERSHLTGRVSVLGGKKPKLIL